MRKKEVLATPGQDVASTLEKKVTHRGLKSAERIAAMLRQEIVTGAYHTGDKLLPERILQQQCDFLNPSR